MKKWVSSSSLFGIQALLDGYGVDAFALARRAGLSELAFGEATVPIDALAFNQFLYAATRECGDRYLNLRLALHQGWDILGAAWQGIRSAGCLRDALSIIAGSLELHTPALACYLKEEPGGLALCYEVRWDREGDLRLEQGEELVIELGLAVTCLEIRRLLGDSWRPAYVQFRHERPELIQPLQKCFGEHIAFNQDCNAIFLTHEEAQAPLTERWLEGRERVDKSAEIKGDECISMSIKTDRVIRKLNGESECSIASVAQYLSLPVRTLQDQLQREGTSYQVLLDKVRLDSAIHYLRASSLSMAEIAERLNFSETSAFSRFFKSRMGLTPRQIRSAKQ